MQNPKKPLKKLSLAYSDGRGRQTTRFDVQYDDASRSSRSVVTDPEGGKTVEILILNRDGTKTTSIISIDSAGRTLNREECVQADGTYSENVLATDTQGRKSTTRRHVIPKVNISEFHEDFDADGRSGYSKSVAFHPDGSHEIKLETFRGDTKEYTVRQYDSHGNLLA